MRLGLTKRQVDFGSILYKQKDELTRIEAGSGLAVFILQDSA